MQADTLLPYQTALPGGNATYYTLRESRGPLAHFYGANGFTVAAYSPLLCRLAPYFDLFALENRALWPGMGSPPGGLRCRQYAADLLGFLQQQADGPVIGIGHSMGATTTVMAAIEQPELFRRLILIEPVFQSWRGEWLSRLLPWAVLKRLPLFQATLNRADSWPDLAAVTRDFRALPMFRRLSDATVGFLARALTVPEGPGRKLAFPVSWELHNYRTLDALWHRLAKCTVPVTLIRARPSLFLDDAKARQLQKRLPHCQSVSLPQFGHLLPIEAPEATVRAIVAQM
ncbi:MAG: alpha/beta fold hydrolase [Saccharospirillum sp.]